LNHTFRLALGFADDRGSALAHRPLAHIFVNNELGRGANGAPLVSRYCTTLAEFEEAINELKEELETIRKLASSKFAAEERRFNQSKHERANV
jgi:hypothetical protein